MYQPFLHVIVKLWVLIHFNKTRLNKGVWVVYKSAGDKTYIMKPPYAETERPTFTEDIEDMCRYL